LPQRPRWGIFSGDFLYNLIFPNQQDPDEVDAAKAFQSFFSAAHAKDVVVTGLILTREAAVRQTELWANTKRGCAALLSFTGVKS
jgi:hypothetical protein